MNVVEGNIRAGSVSDQLSLLESEEEQKQQVDQSSPKIKIWTTAEVQNNLSVSHRQLTKLKKTKEVFQLNDSSVTIQFLREESKPRKTNLWEVQEA